MSERCEGPADPAAFAMRLVRCTWRRSPTSAIGPSNPNPNPNPPGAGHPQVLLVRLTLTLTLTHLAQVTHKCYWSV